MSRRITAVVALIISFAALGVSAGALVLSAGAARVPAAVTAAVDQASAPAAAAARARLDEALGQARARADRLEDRLNVVEAALDSATSARRRLEVERDALEARLAGDGAVHRRIRIARIDEAHALLPPKLMLSVTRLGRGEASICAGKERARSMFVGELLDLPVDGRDCWLVLLESGPEGARFVFGCDAAEPALAKAPT